MNPTSFSRLPGFPTAALGSGYDATVVMVPISHAEPTQAREEDPHSPRPTDVPPPGLNAAASRSDGMPTVGQIGRYALKYRLGSGGLGTVYAAHDPVLNRLIAIKTLNFDLPLDERDQFNQMFLNEARAAACLGHPHIVTVHDAGLSEQGVYIAMELLRGNDLRKLLKDGWRPTAGQAALIVRRVADALAYAHARGVIHRDIKPANIFMVSRTQPRVLDFGIAQVASRQDEEDSLVGGSPYYMAPEQLEQRQTDRRTDVFSLGVVLYELLTGVRPFQGNSLQEIGQAVRSHRPPPVHDLTPHIDPELAAIVARAMEKNPEMRFLSARAFAHELRSWMDKHPAVAKGSTAEEDSPTALVNRRRIWGLMGLAVGSGILSAVIFWQPQLRPLAAATQHVKALWDDTNRQAKKPSLDMSVAALLANPNESSSLDLMSSASIPAAAPAKSMAPGSSPAESPAMGEAPAFPRASQAGTASLPADENDFQPKLLLAPMLLSYPMGLDGAKP